MISLKMNFSTKKQCAHLNFSTDCGIIMVIIICRAKRIEKGDASMRKFIELVFIAKKWYNRRYEKEYPATNYESDLTDKQFARKEPNYV